MLGEHARPAVPMGLLHAREIRMFGVHGMPAHDYPRLLALVAAGRLDPGRLVTHRLTLSAGAQFLTRMGDSGSAGVAVVTDFAS
jgi:alcohol dehydrogenase